MGGTLEIYDAGGLSFSQLHAGGLRLLARVLGLGAAHYPENLGKAFIINAPSVFAMGWRIIKPVLNKNTQAKISINAGGCREELLELFEGDESKVDAVLNS